MSFSDSFRHWLYSLPLFLKIRHICNTHNIESLNFQVRLIISITIFILSIISPFLTEFHIILHVFFPLMSILYLYLLFHNKTELLFGLPYLLVLLVLAGLVLQKSDCYLCMLTSSLGAIAILSAQGYPPQLPLIMGIGFIFLQKHFMYRLEEIYEPITDCYRISASSLDSAVKGWLISLVLEIFCLVTYQITFKKIWKHHQKVKFDMEMIIKNLKDKNLLLNKTIEDLEKNNRELTQTLKTRQLFVACVTHEIRNPLNVLLNGIDQVASETKAGPHLELIKTLQMCGEAILNQVNNLLDAAKITEEKIDINPTLTKMSTFLDKFWSLTKIGLDKKGLSGHLTVDKNIPLHLFIDSHRLHQILDNLLGNALKFTTKGSVRVTLYWIHGIPSRDCFDTAIDNVRAENRITRIGSQHGLDFEEGSKMNTHLDHDYARRNNMSTLSDFISVKSRHSVQETLDEVLDDRTITEDNYLRVDIVDTGCGIAEDEQKSIFEPFEQANKTVSRRYGGTGLGLFIVKKLVEKMGGTIKLTSLQNVGTRFQVLLPIIDSGAA